LPNNGLGLEVQQDIEGVFGLGANLHAGYVCVTDVFTEEVLHLREGRSLTPEQREAEAKKRSEAAKIRWGQEEIKVMVRAVHVLFASSEL
jgi:hypothetical protein